jgi:ComF family protein
VTLHFESARAVGKYSTPLKELIHSLKYSRERAAAGPLAEILLEALRGSPAAEFAEVVVPVPLHRLRLKKRTFNQSALVGKLIAAKLGLPFVRALTRMRPTPSQTELSHSARRKNVKDAFAVRRPQAVKGRQVLLVDDVITSGATASECAKALKAAGASRVYAAAIAR